ncbi:MAG: pyruvate kinase [Candidatus Aminicenantes bacterium]|nr:pyruvate kinase [Candidatus Aminicenantes bacterium]
MKTQDKMKFTKIICTVGPSSESVEVLEKMLKGGMSVARLNFSHGDHSTHKRSIKNIRTASKNTGIPTAILADLSGPKIRVGELSEPVELKKNKVVSLGTRKGEGTIYTDFTMLPEIVKKGDPILIDDGNIELKVTEVKSSSVDCKVVTPGVVKSKKGINLPSSGLSIPVFTKKDREDLKFSIGEGVDLIAMSFVDSPENIVPVRKMLKTYSADIPVIAKIERPQALDNIIEIVDAFDGIMIARGDLGVEVLPEKVPIIQKELILLANRENKLVITATQMLESMISSPRPTRAEASDVSNAILDGSDCVMLSGETAVGKYPVKAVNIMERIAGTTEGSSLYPYAIEKDDYELQHTEAIAKGAAEMAFDMDVKALMVFSWSGSTALLLSKYRPPCPVFAFTPDPGIRNRMAAYWGVSPRLIKFTSKTDDMIIKGEQELKADGYLKKGDTLLVVAGETPMKGATNMLKFLKVT